MPQGLSVSRLVRLQINLSPLAAARRSFGVLLIAGDSNVINPVERIRSYSGIDGVAADFGVNAPEYKAASLYFGQTPKPATLNIGRWVRTASSGMLQGGILTPGEQSLSNFTAITTGAFRVSIDGAALTVVSGLDFSAQTNLNGVAAVIDAALPGATVAWTGGRFVITSSTTGATSSVGYVQAPLSGADISALLKLTSSTALAPVPGFIAESPVEGVAALANASAAWYGLMFATDAANMPSVVQGMAVATFIEALDIKRIYGVTETDTRVLDSAYTADFASTFKALAFNHSFVQYSANLYAVASFFGRAFSVNFSANRSTITMMYKQEPSVNAEYLTETQAVTLKTKRCNVFVHYQNDTSIIQYGVMSGTAYFDEIHGLDWFGDAAQNNLYNLLYTSKTKIPQTEAGQNQLETAVAQACEEAVNNGLVAPGTWNADGFGQLERGQFLTQGYYIYAEPIASQPQAIREQRIAPPIQAALKLAGAFQELDVIVNVNR